MNGVCGFLQTLFTILKVKNGELVGMLYKAVIYLDRFRIIFVLMMLSIDIVNDKVCAILRFAKDRVNLEIV